MSTKPGLPANWRTLNWALNIYVCESSTPDGRAHVMTTVDVDEGVTPFLATCPVCNGTMRSKCYPSARPIPDWVPEPSEEWYKPTRTEMRDLKLLFDDLGGAEQFKDAKLDWDDEY